MTSTDSRINIGASSTWTIVPLTNRADVGRWIWSVKASEPGDYELLLEVAVLAGGTAEPLVPPESVVIRVTAERVPESERGSPAPAQSGTGSTQLTDVAAPPARAPDSTDAKGIADSDTGWTIEKVILPIVLAIFTLAGVIIAAWLGSRSRRDAPPGTAVGGSTAPQAAFNGRAAPSPAPQRPAQRGPGGRGA
ncbi:hypothetical protein OOJ91_33510 [Micromonospora lupini]|uniref:hypothetical protein n=1 Tax=Micromonospora lupini TaxID=285679 RepID=UPI0022516CE5|nr:hypothetical protein [Micromonospora lupini]MCX5070764.1 hypothetical protein [Micromonospora lupini]